LSKKEPNYVNTKRYKISRQRQWDVTIELGEVEGRLDCVRFSVASVSERAITATDLRQIPLGQLVQQWRADYLKLMRVAVDADKTGTVRKTLSRRVTAAERSKPRKRGGRRPEHDYQQIASVYQAAWVRGDLPTKAVQDHFKLSPSAAAKAVHRARQQGLLPRTERGVAKGKREEG